LPTTVGLLPCRRALGLWAGCLAAWTVSHCSRFYFIDTDKNLPPLSEYPNEMKTSPSLFVVRQYLLVLSFLLFLYTSQPRLFTEYLELALVSQNLPSETTVNLGFTKSINSLLYPLSRP